MPLALTTVFADLPDPRIETANKLHPLTDILVIATCAVIAGADGWEEIGGPHLIGHPNQRIFHWFQIGGYGSYGASIYYADSATSVWSGVQPFSWYDRDAMVVILGGRGYAW